MRTIPALAVSAGLIVSLAACTSDPLGGCDPHATPGAASELVTATGELGDAPTIDFPTRLVTQDVESSALIVGEGERVSQGDSVRLQFTVAEGASGNVVGQSDYAGDPQLATLGSDSLASIVSEGLQCHTVGSRVAIVASADRTHQGQTGGAFAPDASLVYVIDILDGFPARADGAPQTAINGLPAVVTAPDGRPGITIPSKPAPEEFTATPLQRGGGADIGDDDTVLVKYTGVLWDDGGVFDSSWADGTAVPVDLASGTVFPASVNEAIAEHTLGTQLLVVVPPSDDDGAGPAVPSGSTLVYVIDLLGVLSD